MSDQAETEARPILRTLRIGTPFLPRNEAPSPNSERPVPSSRMRPEAPSFYVPAEPVSVSAAFVSEERSPFSTRRRRTPIDEVTELLRRLEIRELGDVLAYAQRLLAARGQMPDPAVGRALLAAMGRLHPAYRTALGVPLPILRGALVDVPRRAFDDALLDAENHRMVRLVPVSPHTPFVEKAAGIHDTRRGLLYYCAAP